MVIESKEFDIVPEGEETPELEPPVISSGLLG